MINPIAPHIFDKSKEAKIVSSDKLGFLGWVIRIYEQIVNRLEIF